MILAFTGTQRGMTSVQEAAFTAWLSETGFSLFLNGGCRGADRQAVYHVIQRGIPIEIFPGDELQSQWAQTAWVGYAIKVYPVPLRRDPHLARNQVMAKLCDHLVATPKESAEVNRSGTWATIRYARNANKPRTIIYPNGSIQQEK